MIGFALFVAIAVSALVVPIVALLTAKSRDPMED